MFQLNILLITKDFQHIEPKPIQTNCKKHILFKNKNKKLLARLCKNSKYKYIKYLSSKQTPICFAMMTLHNKTHNCSNIFSIARLTNTKVVEWHISSNWWSCLILIVFLSSFVSLFFQIFSHHLFLFLPFFF